MIALDYTHGANRAKDARYRTAVSRRCAPVRRAVSRRSRSSSPACNEEAKLPEAFRSLLGQSYPGAFQIVAVDDRSTDGTPALLDALAGEAPCRQIRRYSSPDRPSPRLAGQKPRALSGREAGDRRVSALHGRRHSLRPRRPSPALSHFAQREDLDHLSSFFRLDLRGFWETVFGLGFSFLFFLRFRPWRVRDPKSDAYLGIGGFNLVRRTAYDAIGGHRAIALEVADDMELGRRLKQAGFRSDVIGSAHHIVVRWQDDGLRGLMNGLTKNAYAGLDYSPRRPRGLGRRAHSGNSLALARLRHPHADRRARVGYGLAVVAMTTIGARHARAGGIPAAYALTLPFSTLLLIAVMFRSRRGDRASGRNYVARDILLAGGTTKTSDSLCLTALYAVRYPLPLTQAIYETASIDRRLYKETSRRTLKSLRRTVKVVIVAVVACCCALGA